MPQTGYGYMPDFGQLMQIGANFGQGYQNRRVANAMEGFDGNYEEAANKLMQMGRIDEAVKLYSAAALGDYRTGMLGVANQKAEPSVEDQLLRQYLTPQGPSYLSPPDTESAADAAEEAEASGAPGTAYTRPSGLPSAENAPKVVQDKLLSIQDQRRLEEEGKGQGIRNSFSTALKEQAPKMQATIDQLIANTQAADPGTFQHALGPLQGAGEAETVAGAIGNFFPQTFGATANYFEKGMEHGFLKEGGDFKQPGELPGGYTSTLRANINATSATLVNMLQRLLRVPGVGAQSDYELRQIIAQVGELNKSRDKADFYDRLSNVVTNMNNQGIPVKMPSPERVSGVQPTKAVTEQYTNPPETQNATMSPTVNENTMIGGENIGRTTSQPPTPPKKALNALRAYKNNPQARAAFDEIYGPGASDFYLQKYR